MTTMVRSRQLVRRYGQTLALDAIDLDVEEGESLALLGHHGSGRTTLLQILAALRPPTSGTLEIAGVDVVRSPFKARLQTAYAGAGLPAAAGLRVREYLEFVRMSRRLVAPKGTDSVVDLALDRSGLPADVMVDRLSAGFRKRLVLAAAMVASPRVLLLDDPFASLDADGRLRVLGWAMELRAAGITIVASMNDPADARALCDAILRLDRGRIVSREIAETRMERIASLGEAGAA
jgi:ABC-2 type transport system ATP-binding protein